MNRHRRYRGFTLIETVVALAILGLGLAVLIPVFGDVLDRNARADARATAASLAQSLLARLDNDLPLAPGTTTGRFDNGYRWEIAITPYGDDADRGAWPLTPYQVLATVAWPAGQAERSVMLTTLRLAPKGAAP